MNPLIDKVRGEVPKSQSDKEPTREDGFLKRLLRKGDVSAWFKKPTPAFARSKEEIDTLKRRLRVSAELVSGTFGIDIVPSTGWAVAPDPAYEPLIMEVIRGERDPFKELPAEALRYRKLHTDERWLVEEPDEDVIYGVLYHEIGHIIDTDARYAFEGQRRAINDGNLPMTYQHLWNSIEDVWINIRQEQRSERAREVLQKLYRDKWLPLHQRGEIRRATPNEQLGFCIIHYWLEGTTIPQVSDPVVLDTFQKIEPAVNEYFLGESSEENFAVLYEKIWPHVRSLEKHSILHEALKNLQNGSRAHRSNGKGENGSSPKIPTGGKGKELSQKDFEKLKREFDRLPESVKKQLVEEARKQYDDKMASANKENLPPGTEISELPDGQEYALKLASPPSKDEEGQAMERRNSLLRSDNPEEEPNDGGSQSLREFTPSLPELTEEEREMLKNGFSLEDKERYRRFTTLEREMKRTTDRHIHLIEEVIPREFQKIYHGEFYSGRRLERRRLSRRIPVSDSRIYQRTERAPSELAPFFAAVILDCSSSMYFGKKMQESVKFLISFGSVTHRFEMPYSIRLFAERDLEILSFRDSYHDPRSRVKPNLIQVLGEERSDRRDLLRKLGSGTDISIALRNTFVQCQIEKRIRPDMNGIIILVSDGDATTGSSGKDLVSLVEEVNSQFSVVNVVLGLEVAPSSNEYFGPKNVVCVPTVEELQNCSAQVYADAFRRHMKREEV